MNRSLFKYLDRFYLLLKLRERLQEVVCELNCLIKFKILLSFIFQNFKVYLSSKFWNQKQ